MQSDIITVWKSRFPGLAGSSDKRLLQLMSAANVAKLPTHHRVFDPGASCKNYLLVVSGVVRVQILAETGREVVLYRVNPGESCILTTSCLLGEKHYPAEGITESDVTALAMSAADFNEALMCSEDFRKFVFSTLGQRLAEIILKMEQVTFGAIDSRLASILLRRQDPGGMVKATHQELATELGTAREVVSRHLKRFEGQNWVKLGRGTIIVNSPRQLEAIVHNEIV